MSACRHELIDVEKRLFRLEKQNRQLKVILILGSLAIGSLFILGARQPSGKSITANEFILVDSDGQKLAILSSNKESSGYEIPYLTFFDGTSSFLSVDTNRLEQPRLRLSPNGILSRGMGQNGEWFTTTVNGYGLTVKKDKDTRPVVELKGYESLASFGPELSLFSADDGVLVELHTGKKLTKEDDESKSAPALPDLNFYRFYEIGESEVVSFTVDLENWHPQVCYSDRQDHGHWHRRHL